MSGRGIAFPQIDRDQIHRFVQALFCHATGGYVQLRAFRDDADGTWRSNDWPAVAMEAGIDNLIDAAAKFAGQCASAREAVVFVPPVATFNDPQKAAEKNVDSGVSLSVDLDQKPTQARERLIAALGQPTVAVATGGEWVDPATGEVQPKVHLHWRLSSRLKLFLTTSR